MISAKRQPRKPLSSSAIAKSLPFTMTQDTGFETITGYGNQYNENGKKPNDNKALAMKNLTIIRSER